MRTVKPEHSVNRRAATILVATNGHKPDRAHQIVECDVECDALLEGGF